MRLMINASVISVDKEADMIIVTKGSLIISWVHKTKAYVKIMLHFYKDQGDV